MNRRFLNPGGLYFGAGDLRVETLLGPCVAIVLWFPGARLGGMCHFQLPGKGREVEHAPQFDGRYGSDAWMWLKQQVRAHGLHLRDGEMKLFGGARSLTGKASHLHHDIGAQNIAFVESIAQQSGMPVVARDLGGEGSRYLRFDLATGELWLRRGAPLPLRARGRGVAYGD